MPSTKKVARIENKRRETSLYYSALKNVVQEDADLTVRVAMLTRLSEKPSEQEIDLPRQRKDITDYCNKRGWVIVQEYTEPGVSAFRTDWEDREQLQEALNEAKRKPRPFDAVVVWKLDRLARSPVHLPFAIDRFEAAGVRVYSLMDDSEEAWSTKDPEGQFRLWMKGSQGWQESQNISIRVSAARRSYAQEGRFLGGPIPFGYKLELEFNPDGTVKRRGGKRGKARVAQNMVVDSDHAPVVREMFRRYLAGDGFLAIADWLNSQPQVRRPRSGEWTNQAVKFILSNPIYAGLMQYARTRNYTPRRPLTDEIERERLDLRIIDPDVFDAVQSLRARKVELHPRMRSSDRPYSGTLRCAVCGGLMGATSWSWKNKQGRQVAYGYRCMRSIQSKSCTRVGHNMRDIEKALMDAFDNLTHPAGILGLVRESAAASEAEYQAAVRTHTTAEKQLTEVRAGINKLYQEYYTGKTSEAEKNRALEALTQLEEQLTRLSSQPLPKRCGTDFDRLAVETKEFRRNWPFLSPSEQKSFLMNLCTGLNIAPYIHENGAIEWRVYGRVQLAVS